VARYDFTLLAEITDIEVIARGTGVRARHYLNRKYGRGQWRKLKEAVAADMSVSAFLRRWLDEHLDLPEPA